MGIKLDTVPLLFLAASLAIVLTGRFFFDYSITDALLYGSLVGFTPLAILTLLCIVLAVFLRRIQ